METVSNNYCTAVMVHMIILLILLGIWRQSLVDHLVNQLMVIRHIDVMLDEVMLIEIAI